MAWIYLLLAGLTEIGWPLGFKLADTMPKYHYLFLAIAIVSMALSGYLLFQAQKEIPIGTAYAVWTGIGSIGTFLIGIAFFNDSASLMRIFSVSFIVLGLVGLKLSQA